MPRRRPSTISDYPTTPAVIITATVMSEIKVSSSWNNLAPHSTGKFLSTLPHVYRPNISLQLQFGNKSPVKILNRRYQKLINSSAEFAAFLASKHSTIPMPNSITTSPVDKPKTEFSAFSRIVPQYALGQKSSAASITIQFFSITTEAVKQHKSWLLPNPNIVVWI